MISCFFRADFPVHSHHWIPSSAKQRTKETRFSKTPSFSDPLLWLKTIITFDSNDQKKNVHSHHSHWFVVWHKAVSFVWRDVWSDSHIISTLELETCLKFQWKKETMSYCKKKKRKSLLKSMFNHLSCCAFLWDFVQNIIIIFKEDRIECALDCRIKILKMY